MKKMQDEGIKTVEGNEEGARKWRQDIQDIHNQSLFPVCLTTRMLTIDADMTASKPSPGIPVLTFPAKFGNKWCISEEWRSTTRLYKTVLRRGKVSMCSSRKERYLGRSDVHVRYGRRTVASLCLYTWSDRSILIISHHDSPHPTDIRAVSAARRRLICRLVAICTKPCTMTEPRKVKVPWRYSSNGEIVGHRQASTLLDTL